MAGDENLIVNDDFCLKAINVELNARGDILSTGGTYINLLSEGSGPLFDNGVVHISGSGGVSLSSGGSLLGLTNSLTSNTIVLGNNTAMGSVVFWQGMVPGCPKVTLTGGPPPSLDLEVGLPNVGSKIQLSDTGLSLKFGPTASVELGPTGITMKFAAWTLSMDATGINMAVGPNKISLAAQGVNVEGLITGVKGTTQLSLEGIMVSQQGSAQTQDKGVVTMVG